MHLGSGQADCRELQVQQDTHGPQHVITGLRAHGFKLVAGMGSDNQDGGYGKGGPTISEPSSSPSFAAADSGTHWTLSGTNTVMFASCVKLHTAKYQLDVVLIGVMQSCLSTPASFRHCVPSLPLELVYRNVVSGLVF